MQRDIALREVRALVADTCAWCEKPIQMPVSCHTCGLAVFCGNPCKAAANSQHMRVCGNVASQGPERSRHLTFKVAIAGDVAVAQKLHAAKEIDVRRQASSGMYLLNHAVCNGHAELITWAVNEAGVDANAVCNDGLTALHSGAHQPTDENNGPSIARGVRALIATGKANVNAPDQCHSDQAMCRYAPLLTAMDARNMYVFDELLAAPGIDVNWRSAPCGPDAIRVCPTFMAVSTGNTAALRKLFDAGASLAPHDATRTTLLMAACMNKMPESVKMLLEHPGVAEGMGVLNSVGSNALHVACSEGCPKCIDAVLKHPRGKALVNTGDTDGDTPLTFVAMYGHLTALKMLEKHGADFSIRNRKGSGPFDLAMTNGHTHVARYIDEFVSAPDGAHSHAKDGVKYIWPPIGGARFGLVIGTPEWERAMGRGQKGFDEAKAFLARMMPRYVAGMCSGVGHQAPPRVCSHCKRDEAAAKAAGGVDKFRHCPCNPVGNPMYCGKECQKKDWPDHKEFCTAQTGKSEADAGGEGKSGGSSSSKSKSKKAKGGKK